MMTIDIKTTLIFALCLIGLGHVTSATAQAITIMPLGDSITEGYQACSYRKPLVQSLGSCNVQMVGTISAPQSDPGNCLTSNNMHEGHSGYTTSAFLDTTRFFPDSKVSIWYQVNPADVVLLHVGSNDMAERDTTGSFTYAVGTYEPATNTGTATIGRINEMINQIYSVNSNVKILVGDLIPWYENFPGTNNRIDELRRELYFLVADRYEDGDDIFIVDVNDGYTSDMMQGDQIHPAAAGESHMAGKWLGALKQNGICAPQSVTLENNQWEMLSFPGSAAGKSVRTLISSNTLPESGYGNTWAVYTYDTTANTYLVGINQTIDTGEAYWIKQISGQSVTINIGAAAAQPSPVISAACASNGGCFSQALPTASNHTVWTMRGVPFSSDTAVSDIRIVNNSNCSSGCTLTAAAAHGITNDYLTVFDPATGGYQRLGSGDVLPAWQGFWIPMGSLANGTQPTLLLPAAP